MRSLSFLCILCLFTSLACAELAWKKQTISYTAKPSDEDVTAVFYFKNESAQPVSIINTRSSCGCTVVNLEKKDYLPGEMGKLKAKFTFGSRTGFQQKMIRVYTNDPDKPLYLLKLEVQIPLTWTVSPQLLSWSGDQPKTMKSCTVTIAGNNSITITSAKSDSDDFDVELLELLPGKQYQINITPKPNLTKANARITLESSVVLKDGSHRSAVIVADVSP